jgi:hypothetical protein
MGIFSHMELLYFVLFYLFRKKTTDKYGGKRIINESNTRRMKAWVF